MSLSRTARANGPGLPDTINVSLVPGNTTELGIEANFGYLDAEDGKNFTWICHEVLVPSMASITPYFYRNSNGAFLATVRSLGIANNPNVSLFYSTDGCTWNAVTGMDQVLIRENAVAFDPNNPLHAMAFSANGSSTPVPNGNWISNDGGQSWTQGSLSLLQRFFRTVRFAPSDSNTIYASASWFTPTPQAWVYASTNGGVSFTEYPWTFNAPSTTTLQTNVDIVAVSPTNSKIVYARTDGSTDYLLRSIDGGANWTLVHTAASDDIRGTTYEPGTLAVWTASMNFGTFRAADGVTFDPIAAAPHSRGVMADPRGVFVVANNYADGYALGLTTNAGASFTGLFTFDKIAGVRDCPAGSTVKTICDPLYPALLAQLGLTPSPSPTASATPTPPGGKGSGCKCDVGGGDAPVALAALAGAALAGAWVRRRKP